MHVRMIKLWKVKIKEEITIKITYGKRQGVMTGTGQWKRLLGGWRVRFVFTWVVFTLYKFMEPCIWSVSFLCLCFTFQCKGFRTWKPLLEQHGQQFYLFCTTLGSILWRASSLFFIILNDEWILVMIVGPNMVAWVLALPTDPCWESNKEARIPYI